MLYREGEVVPQDLQLAITYLSKAAEAGDVDSQVQLGKNKKKKKNTQEEEMSNFSEEKSETEKEQE